MKQKRVVAIHDISGFGKCSLTVALPVVSAAGIETSVLPTSVLSTHTGGFTGYTFRDLTDDITKIADHWKSIGLEFDGIYTGYLGSAAQVELISRFVDDFSSSVVIVDPAMADHGKLYAGFKEGFPKLMLGLCKKADFILPNITEALFMLGREYVEGPYTKEFIEELLFSLHNEGIKNIVLTGVYFENDKIGAACSDGKTTEYILHKKIDKIYHGTGDVFASAFCAAYMRGANMKRATEIAAGFTVRSIECTLQNNPERNYGVNFEQALKFLIGEIEND